MANLSEAIDFIRALKRAEPEADKTKLQAAFRARFMPRVVRSVLVGEGYALRFSQAETTSFPGTVLGLSVLERYDAQPFVVVAVRPRSVDFLLSKSTFLKKVSHSSHDLRCDNIRGSFNGSDISAEYDGLRNDPANFAALFAIHDAFSWDENVERLVEATHAIVGRDLRFRPTAAQAETVLTAPERSASALSSEAFAGIERELSASVARHRDDILEASRVDNVNLRGRAIERLLTAGHTSHELGDFERRLGTGRLIVDIKTKLLDRASAPKAYNIEKLLRFLAEPGSVFAFLLIAIDTSARTVVVRLVPVLDSALLDATRITHHWAGRSSRGVTQLSGPLGRLSDPRQVSTVDLGRAKAFLRNLIAL